MQANGKRRKYWGWETIAESNFHWLSSSSVIKGISVAGQVSMIPQINEQNSMFSHSIPFLTVVVTYHRMIVVPFLHKASRSRDNDDEKVYGEGLYDFALFQLAWQCTNITFNLPFRRLMELTKHAQIVCCFVVNNKKEYENVCKTIK